LGKLQKMIPTGHLLVYQTDHLMKSCVPLISSLFLALLVSCESNQDNSGDLLELREEYEALERQQRRTERKNAKIKEKEREAQEALKLEFEGVKSQLVKSTEELRITKTKKEELEQEIKDLKHDFEQSTNRFVRRARSTGIGLKLDRLIAEDGEAYQNVKIVEFIGNSVRIRHDTGFATLTSESVPRAWVKNYYLDPAEEEQKRKNKIDETSSEDPADNKKSGIDDLERAQKAVVLISGDQSSGTGFFVKSGTRTYLYTAAHVLSGNSLSSLEFVTKSGRKYTSFGKLEVAHDVDVARLHVGEPVPFALTLPKRNSITNGLACVGLGNPGGGTVVTADKGQVQAVGPKSFELDAKLVKGNSGGPIVGEHGKIVYGLVTHALLAKRDRISSGTRYSRIRRFGARFDIPIKWHRTSLSTFLKEPVKLVKIARITRLLFALAALDPGRNGLRLNARVRGGNGKSALYILQENKDMRVVQRILKMNRSLSEKKIKPDQKSLNKHFRNLLNEALSAAKSRMLSIKNSGTSPYHMEEAKDLFQTHAEAVKNLQNNIQRIGR